MNQKIVITGAAGLVGQNLILELQRRGFKNIVALDKHATNNKILRQLNPAITLLEADLSTPGAWCDALDGCDVLVTLHAQIGAMLSGPFMDNNIKATEVVLEQAKLHHVPYIIHASSSVVESVADDDYTNTKKRQEQLVINAGIPYCILRPTLMFGWFDRKHLGWLSRFMQRIPIFPIPGNGNYMRQPLYVRDFCGIIASCITKRPTNEIYNITGKEKIFYIDMIRKIRAACHARTLIIRIPYSFFWVLLKIYAIFDHDPPFTTDQLKALTAGDEFELIEWWTIFDVPVTPLDQAITETFSDPIYSKIILDF